MRVEIGPGNLRRIVARGLVHLLEPCAPIGIARAGVIHRVEPRARRKPPRREVSTVRIDHCRGAVFFAVFVGFCGFLACMGSATRSIEASLPPMKR